MSQKNRIIHLFGQSLALGREPLATLPVARQGHLHNLRVYGSGAGFHVINHNEENNQFGDPRSEWGIEFELQDLATHFGNDVYLMKNGIGGTYLNTHAGGDNDWSHSPEDLLGTLKSHVTNLETWMTNRGKSFEHSAVIWIQGHADEGDGTYTNNYEANLRNLISTYDTHLGVSPFWYIVELAHFTGSNAARVDTIQAAQATIVAEDTTKRRLVVDTGTYFDGIHWDDAGNITMGQKIVNLMKSDIS